MIRIAIFCVLLALPNLSLACAAVFSKDQNRVILPKTNQALFSAAVLSAVNAQRCKLAKRPLKANKKARKAAFIHSLNMATTNEFSHTLNISGAKNVKQRAKKAKLRWRWIAENIALVPRYSFRHKTKFRVIDRASCVFAYPGSDRPIPPHTYASLAQTTVENWMASAGHRKNILSRNAKQMGASLVFESGGNNCGRFYITQVFTD